jgi:hypothetical protein
MRSASCSGLCMHISLHRPPSQTRKHTMRNSTKLVLAGLSAALLLSLAVGSASARRIETSERGFLVRFSELSFNAAGNRVSCPVTLEGSFHSRTLSKVSGQLIGYITQAQVPSTEPPCVEGTATALTTTLPWHIQYNSFAGRLPTISRIRITLVGARFQVHPRNSVTCLAGTTQANPSAGDINVEAGGGATTLRALPEFTIPLEGFCGIAGNGNFEGTGEIFTLVTPQVRITVRLVQ